MTIEFKVPALGENVESGGVINVLVAVGDNIKVDQPILELETDKAVIEVPSSVKGVVEEILVQEGDQISPGDVILTVSGDESDGQVTETAPAEEVEEVEEPDTSEPTTPTTEAPESEPEPAEPASEAEATPTLVEFNLPELGENVETGTVVNILVSVGDTIEVDQPVLELETDKAVLEVPSSVSGVVEEILVKEGDQAGTGQTVLTVQSTAAQPQPAPAHAEPEPAPTTEAPSLPSPPKGGDKEPEPPAAPKIEPAPTAPSPNGGAPALTQVGEKLYDIAPAAPSVRRFAREIGIDIHYVPGSGPGGRISIEDVKTWSRKLQTEVVRPAAVPAPAAAAAQKPLPDFSKWGEIKRESMSGIRRATAQNVGYSWATVPHVTQHDKADVTELEKLRKHYAKKVEAAGGKLTVTAILLKVVAAALKVFPKFNSSLDMEQLELIYKQYYHIGMAVDTPHGLLVPVIRDVDQKNLIELSVELGEVAEKARNRKISLEEMQGGCFTISNLGGIGGTSFTPIVNTPEVAILGVARGRTEPVWVDDKFEPRLMLPLSLSYDHRVIDGAEGARFIRWVAEALEQPFVLMLEG